MYPVGYITHMVLFREVSLPDRRKHLLGYRFMQLADAVYLLAGLAGEDRHAETFLLVSRIVTPEIHQVIPGYTQLARISLHIFIEKPFVKIIMTSGYGSMYSIK